MTLLHSYMGLHVIRRGVIFVDLALAQMAAFGSAVGLFLAPMVLKPIEPPASAEIQVEAAALQDSDVEAFDRAELMEREEAREHRFRYVMSLVFTLIGAALFSIGRYRDERVPHEAIIGIVYVVAAALAMLVLNKTAHGAEELENLLVGQILFVSKKELLLATGLYAFIALIHVFFGRVFLRISNDLAEAEAAGLRVRLWDFLFYATFGLLVTQSVKMAGVLVVFSFLVIPAVCASLLARRFWVCLILGWIVALIASLAGLGYSWYGNMPTGPALVAAFGLTLLVCAAVHQIQKRLQAS
jgi:zinc/manganese transport system permease protein